MWKYEINNQFSDVHVIVFIKYFIFLAFPLIFLSALADSWYEDWTWSLLGDVHASVNITERIVRMRSPTVHFCGIIKAEYSIQGTVQGKEKSLHYTT